MTHPAAVHQHLRIRRDEVLVVRRRAVRATSAAIVARRGHHSAARVQARLRCCRGACYRLKIVRRPVAPAEAEHERVGPRPATRRQESNLYRFQGR